jgi:hypothetical protein
VSEAGEMEASREMSVTVDPQRRENLANVT